MRDYKTHVSNRRHAYYTSLSFDRHVAIVPRRYRPDTMLTTGLGAMPTPPVLGLGRCSSHPAALPVLKAKTLPSERNTINLKQSKPVNSIMLLFVTRHAAFDNMELDIDSIHVQYLPPTCT